MASVFLSYDRDEADRARHFAQALEDAGHEVWWDLHVRGGAQFSKVIEQALKAADAVVVLWSRQSVESPWVRDEASAGRDAGRLIPVTIDGTEAPLGFRQFQTIDLSKWKGRGQPSALRTLLDDVAAVAKDPGLRPAGAKRYVPRLPTLRRNWVLAGATLVLLIGIAAGVILWRPWTAHAGPTLVVRAAATDAGLQSLARDLAVKLASLQGVKSGSVRLVSETEAAAQRPDFALEVGEAAGSNGAANLVLTNPKDGTMIWSSDFQSGNFGDLKQQMAVSAARVLGCAEEAMNPRQGLADQQTFKLYLNSCTQLSDPGEIHPLIAALQQVVAKAPRFAPAWSKLLLVESDQFGDEDDPATEASDAARLRRHISEARAVDPHMAEAIVAEASLRPVDDIGQRMEMLDRAKSAAPDNSAILSRRSSMLRTVGRMRDSVDDARRAMQLDPLSPAVNGAYVNALAFAGRIDAARQAMQEVERQWPGSSTMRELKFEFNLRFGDARQALPEAQERGLLGLELYLEARLDPSKIGSYVAWLKGRKNRDFGALGVLVQGFGEFHYEDDLYQVLSSWQNRSDFARLGDVWFRPALHQFRRDPRFMRVMAQTPLLKYWRSTGHWPDFCFEPDLPYDCKNEAARLS